MEAVKMTREKAIDILEGIVRGTESNDLYDAIRMATEALKAQEPEVECKACMVHYPEEG